MTRDEIRNALGAILADLLGIDDLDLDDSMTANDIEGWDSLTHVHVVLAVENALKVKFDPGELQKLKNVGEMVTAIANHQDA